MDAKLLTEKGWKDVSAKFKIKDNGLQKALAAAEKIKDENYVDLIKALTAVTQFAGTLKKVKEVAASKDATKYLNDVIVAVTVKQGELMKNSAATAKQAADQFAKDIDAGQKAIDAEVPPMTKAIAKCFKNYVAGLQDFDDAILEAKTEKEDAGIWAEVVFKSMVMLVEVAVPGEALALEIFKKATTSFMEIAKDHDGLPQGEATAMEFIKKIRDVAADREDDTTKVVEGMAASFKATFATLAGKEGTADKSAARVLAAFKTFSKTFTASMDRCSANYFEQLFATEYAKAGGGKTEDEIKPGTGLGMIDIVKGRDAGTLYFRVYLLFQGSDGDYTFKIMGGTSPKWKLVRIGDKKEAAGTAKALKSSFGYAWNIKELPKKVQISATSNPMEAMKGSSGDYQHSGWLVFKANSAGKPDSFEDVSGDKQMLIEAWNDPDVRKEVVKNADLEGDTK